MIFSDPLFIFAFLPLFLVAFYLPFFSKYKILIFSSVFYAAYSLRNYFCRFFWLPFTCLFCWSIICSIVCAPNRGSPSP